MTVQIKKNPRVSNIGRRNVLNLKEAKVWSTVPSEVVLSYVVAEAQKCGFIEKVILFGSRARGNARPFSDYDLAVKLLPGTPPTKWLAFAEKLDDEAPTLSQLSLIEIKPSIRVELLWEIKGEGQIIYER